MGREGALHGSKHGRKNKLFRGWIFRAGAGHSNDFRRAVV